MRTRQLSFLPKLSAEHGGELRLGKRKLMRAIDPKRPLHVVLRSSRARGEWSLLHPRNHDSVNRLTYFIADRHGVKVYQYVNVGNHLHLLVKTPARRNFQAFLRELTGAIASRITGGRKSHPSGRFWDRLAYTRIVTWGRDFRNLELYFIKNLFEAAGLFSRKAKAAGLRPIPISGWAAPPS